MGSVMKFYKMEPIIKGDGKIKVLTICRRKIKSIIKKIKIKEIKKCPI